MTGGILTVSGHLLLVSEVGSEADFDLQPPSDDTGLYVIVSRHQDAFAISTIVDDGPVRVDTADRQPPPDTWPEQAEIQVNVANPMTVLQMVDESELEPLFVPDRPGRHTVTIYADRGTGEPERYLMVFTPDTRPPTIDVDVPAKGME